MSQNLELNGIRFDWPENFPKDYRELQVQYGPFVAQQVNRSNKIGRNLEDILQEMWSKLCSSSFLEKFVFSAARRYPVHMTCQEACDYLGVHFHTWVWYQRQFSENPESSMWMPDPVEGGKYSRSSIYYTDEIFILEEIRDESGTVMKSVKPRVRPKLSTYGFKAYLARSLHNHFANWCRGQFRHYKESLLSPTTLLNPLSNGEFRCRNSYSDDPPGSWESSLPDQVDVDPADAIDAAKWMCQKGIDPQSEKGIMILELVSRGYDVERIEQCKALKKIKVLSVG